MSLKYKANLVGDIAIMSIIACFVLLIFSMFYEIKNVQFGVFVLIMLYSEMKIKYKEFREVEIDEELKNKYKWNHAFIGEMRWNNEEIKS